MDGNGQSDGYTFFFQIADNGERHACCVRVDAPDAQEASALFREKWTVIESMARDGIRTAVVHDGVITLVMP
jgi:gamma-glutamyltranspeptidase